MEKLIRLKWRSHGFNVMIASNPMRQETKRVERVTSPPKPKPKPTDCLPSSACRAKTGGFASGVYLSILDHFLKETAPPRLNKERADMRAENQSQSRAGGELNLVHASPEIDRLPSTSASRGHHGSVAIVPSLANEGTTARLPGDSRAAQERAAFRCRPPLPQHHWPPKLMVSAASSPRAGLSDFDG
jgi:hypothetical protein